MVPTDLESRRTSWLPPVNEGHIATFLSPIRHGVRSRGSHLSRIRHKEAMAAYAPLVGFVRGRNRYSPM